MQEKEIVQIQIYKIANKLKINQTVVNKIINSYISECRVDLLSGAQIRFLGLCWVEPDVITTDRTMTLGAYANRVALQVRAPMYTCYRVLEEYLAMLRDLLLQGKAVDIRTICTLKPIFEGTEIKSVYTCISSTLKKDIEEGNYVVTSVRVHTFKDMRQTVKEVTVNVG